MFRVSLACSDGSILLILNSKGYYETSIIRKYDSEKKQIPTHQIRQPIVPNSGNWEVLFVGEAKYLGSFVVSSAVCISFVSPRTVSGHKPHSGL